MDDGRDGDFDDCVRGVTSCTHACTHVVCCVVVPSKRRLGRAGWAWLGGVRHLRPRERQLTASLPTKCSVLVVCWCRVAKDVEVLVVVP